MVNSQSQRLEDLHFRVLKLLQEKLDIIQRELASRLGISHGKMNYCLNALIEKGLVRLENFQNGRHKFKYAYLLTPVGVRAKAALASRFLQRKIAEYEALKAEIDALVAELPELDAVLLPGALLDS